MALRLSGTERVKLLASWLDRASTAMLTVGVFAPLAAAIYTDSRFTLSVWVYFFGGIFWLSGAYVLHWLAMQVLGRLD